jgi:HPt (histidine-containing phosphotransfer) domain-containing protein
MSELSSFDEIQLDTRLHSNALQQLRSFDPQGRSTVVLRILGVFVASGHKQIVQLEQALAAGDSQVVGRIAHSLKPSAHAIGAPCLAKVAEAAETEVRAGRFVPSEAPIALLLPALRAGVAAAQREIEALSA